MFYQTHDNYTEMEGTVPPTRRQHCSEPRSACLRCGVWLHDPLIPCLLVPRTDSVIPMTSEQASWVTTMPEFGNLLSPLPAGYAADRLGRKWVILAAAPVFLLGWLIILVFRNLVSLYIARFIQGLAIGLVYAVVPVYLGEISSEEFRGAVTSIFYNLWWFGYLFEYVLGPPLSFTAFTLASASTSIVFFLAFLWQPESPYYFLMKGDTAKARESLSWLLNSSEGDVSDQLERMRVCVDKDRKRKAKWNELVATRTDRKALMILFLVGFVKQFCGLIPLSLYSTETLDEAGSNIAISPDDITILMGVMMLVGSVCSSFTLDLIGRRFLLFVSCTISGVAMFAVGTCYYLNYHSDVDYDSYSWIPPVALMVMSGVSVLGIFPVSVAYSSELFPSSTRVLASSVNNVYTTVLGLLVIKSYLTISDSFGGFVNFYIFAAVCFLGSFLSYTFMPETKGKSFEKIRNELHSRKYT